MNTKINNSKYHSRHQTIEKVVVAVILLLAVVLSSSLYLASGFGFIDTFQIGDDGGFHIGRIQTLCDDMQDGQFPDKMYMSMSAGYGYPAGIMYPDLFLYPFAFLRMLGLPLLPTVILFIVCINAATVWIAYFSAKSFFRSRQIACVFGVLYTLSTYRLYCLFTRFSSGELIALAFLPLIVVCLYNIFTYNKFGPAKISIKTWGLLACGVAATIYSHVLTATIIVGFLAIPVIVILIIKHDKNCLLAVVKAAILCLLLSLAFIVPFLDYFITFKSGMAKGDVTLWFIINSPDRDNYFSFNNQFRDGWAIYLAFIVWPVLCVAKTRKAMFKNARVFGWLLFGFAVVFLILVKSQDFWALGSLGIPVISKIVLFVSSVQFPWRFYGPMILCLVFLLCVCLFILKRYANGCRDVEYEEHGAGFNLDRTSKAGIAMEVLMAVVVVYSMVVAALYPTYIVRPNFVNTHDYFENYMPEADDLYLPDYDRENKDSAFLNYWLPLSERLDTNNKNVEYSDYWQHGTKLFMHVKNLTSTNQQIDIPLVAYPYVYVTDADSGERFDTVIDWWSSFINITLPPNYDGNLICGFEKPVYWTAAEVVSLITLLAFIAGLVYYDWPWKRKRPT